MKEWQYVKLGDVCTIERGGSPRPIEKYITNDDSGINWIKIGDTTNSMYITKTEQKIIPDGMKKSRYVQAGDFLLSNSMSFGRPYILKIDGCIHDGWLLLRDSDNKFDKRFLYYYLSAPTTYEKFKNMAVGGVVNNLNSEMVRNVYVPIPSLVEQKEIAHSILKLDVLIEKRKQQLQKLDELVKARFVEMFGDPMVNPKCWEVLKITDAVEVEPQNGMYKPQSEYVNDGQGIPILRIDGFYDGVVKDFSSLKRVNCTRGEREKYLLKENDIVINRVNSIEYLGKCAHITGMLEDTVYESNMMRMHFDKRFNPVYLTKLLCSKYIYLQIVEHAKLAVNQASINQKDVLDFNIYLPPLELQNQFAIFVEQINKSKLSVQQSLEKLETLKKALMQKYFG